jgi:hypothetical protein
MLRHSRRKEREAHGEDVCRSAAAERLASKSSKRKSSKTDSLRENLQVSNQLASCCENF